MFPADEGELREISDLGKYCVFHVPSTIRSYDVLTPKHIWRIIENDISLFWQRYKKTLGRKAVLDCLLEGCEYGLPLQKWETVMRVIHRKSSLRCIDCGVKTA